LVVFSLFLLNKISSELFPPAKQAVSTSLINSNQDMAKRKIFSSYLIFFHISTFLTVGHFIAILHLQILITIYQKKLSFERGALEKIK
jgi:hypothetical protein